MDQHHDNPLITIALSTSLGLATWLADPNVWRALAVAAACGFIGGVFKAAGAYAWNQAQKRREAKKTKPAK